MAEPNAQINTVDLLFALFFDDIPDSNSAIDPAELGLSAEEEELEAVSGSEEEEADEPAAQGLAVVADVGVSQDDLPTSIQSITMTNESCLFQGEALEYDVRLPTKGMFNRLESFRGCPVSNEVRNAFAGRGFYCSGVYHILRCTQCPGMLGRCTDYIQPGHLEHDCHGKNVLQDQLNPHYSRKMDPIENVQEWVNNAPQDLEIFQRYSTADVRLASFCNINLKINLRPLAERAACAGFYFSGE